jgi:hypothetical protein
MWLLNTRYGYLSKSISGYEGHLVESVWIGARPKPLDTCKLYCAARRSRILSLLDARSIGRAHWRDDWNSGWNSNCPSFLHPLGRKGKQ